MSDQVNVEFKGVESSGRSELREKMYEYYKSYYLNDLGLPNWKDRVESFRMNEEQLVGIRLEDLARRTGVPMNGNRILVVGCGTGAELFYLAGKSNGEVFGIDPLDTAIEICCLKAKLAGFPIDRLRVQAGENMSFPDSYFDLVICFTVLEHVVDVETTLLQIQRVLKPQGKALLVLPDYAYPEEPHYKLLTLPPAFFPSLVKAQLKRIGRPTAFFDSLNLLTRRSLGRRLRRLAIAHHFVREYSYRARPPWPIKLYSLLFRVDRNQFLIITK